MLSKIDPLRVLDQLVAPDLWPDIRQRRPSISPEPPAPPTRRMMTALVALAAAVASSVVVICAFSGERADRPLGQPSTERIVFSGGGGDAQLDLFSVRPDGSDVRQLTDTPASEEQPTVSPNGSRLAFALREPGDPTSWVIGVMDADGANRGEITGTRLDGRNAVDQPAWSPDGSHIAFATYGDGGGIYVTGVDGGPARRLTSAGPPTIHVDSDPAWSPTGDSIAFIRWIIGDDEEPPGYEILKVSATGGEPTLIARFPVPTQGMPDDNGEVRGLSWSPDGSTLAFAADGAVFTLNADGGEAQEVISCEELGCGDGTDAFTDATTWSHDGERIAFTAWLNVPSAVADPPLIYVATLQGNRTVATSTMVGGAFPAWQRVPAGEEPLEPTESPTGISARVIGRVRLEGVPGPVAAADGSIWVATYDYTTERAAVVRIDPTTNEVVASLPIEGTPSNLAADADSVWVPSGEPPSGALLRIDAATNEVTGRVDGVHGPVVVDLTGVWAIEDGLDERDAAVVRIDPRTLAVEARVPVGESPFDMAAGAGSIWLITRDLESQYNDPGDLVRIDATAGQIAATVPVHSSGIWIAADDAGVWVSAWDPEDQHDSKAYFIDASTNVVSGEPGDVYNFRPFAVAEGRVWFISGPHDRGLPDGGVCGLNVSTRTVDVCAEPQSGPDLELAHDPAAFDPTTDSIWLGAFDEPWVTRVGVVPSE